MTAIAAGKLDRRITFQTFTEARDGQGHPAKTWANLTMTPTVWASVEPLDGREVVASDQVVGQADTVFRTRYRGDLSVEMRIVYAGVYYDIASIWEEGRREGLMIMARKAAA